MIRQAISCDVCGAEKKQTNHWFVVCELGGELRLAAWSSRMRLRAGAKHLCGQTCLHKLVDEYMARTIAGRVAAATAEPGEGVVQHSAVDASLTSAAAFSHGGSSARLATPAAERSAATVITAHATHSTSSVIALQPRLVTEPAVNAAMPTQAESPNYASRRWRAEAWERERNRELRASERHPEIARRRKGL